MKASRLRYVAAEQAGLLRSLRRVLRRPAEVLSVWCPACGCWVDPSVMPWTAEACGSCRAAVADRFGRWSR